MTPIHLRAEYWGITVPDDASEPRIHPEYPSTVFMFSLHGWDGVEAIELPPGSWELVCLSKEVTDKIAREIVERTHAGGFGRSSEEWKLYEGVGVAFSPVYSFRSLLRSKGLDPNNTLILQKTA